jgi:hypothetical protein
MSSSQTVHPPESSEWRLVPSFVRSLCFSYIVALNQGSNHLLKYRHNWCLSYHRDCNTENCIHRQAYLHICTSARASRKCMLMHAHARFSLSFVSYPHHPAPDIFLSRSFPSQMHLILIYMTSTQPHATSFVFIWHQYTCNITYDISTTWHMLSIHMQHHC